ncbi:ABC transporter permease [Rhodoflexus sp.]
MISIIFNKEIADFRQDKRSWLIAAVLYMLFALGLTEGYRYYTETTAIHELAAKESYEQWLSQGKKNPHGAAHYGFYAFKPLSPLSILDKGMESYLGQSVWLEAHNQNEVKERQANDAGSLARIGELSAGLVWYMALPLAIILLGFNLFNKERANGTLRLWLSSQVSVRQILVGKWLALYVWSLALLLPMLATAAASVAVADAAAMEQYWGRLWLLFGALLAYVAFWTLATLLVSFYTYQAGTALALLTGFWAVGCFFVPRLSSTLAKVIHPAPSSFEFSENIRLDTELGLDRQTPAAERQKHLQDSLLAQYGVDSIHQLPINYTGAMLQYNEEYGYRVFEKNYGQLHDIYRQQDKVMEWCSLLSPPLAMRHLMVHLSGTGLVRYLHFAQQAEAHRRLIAETMNNDIMNNGAGKRVYESDEKLWRKIPPFVYRASSLVHDAPYTAIALLALGLWLFLAGWWLIRPVMIQKVIES